MPRAFFPAGRAASADGEARFPAWILFDLDGTLTDSSPGILNSVVYALEKMGVTPPPREELFSFIGPPLKQSFQRRFGFDDAEALRAIGYYREYFSAGGLFENAVYPGIPEALERLRSAGKRLCVATSKPEGFSERIVEHFGLTKYFEAVCGAAMDESRTEKAQVLRYALDRLGMAPEDCLMVGDREHDVLGAREAASIPCLGVLWGYGSREELASAGALALVRTPEEMTAWILQ